MLPLMAAWLKHKRRYGSLVEKALYAKMGLVEFIQRLLEKRAVQFFGADDRYKLLSGAAGSDGWENVGTANEREPLVKTPQQFSIFVHFYSNFNIAANLYSSIDYWNEFLDTGELLVVRRDQIILDDGRFLPHGIYKRWLTRKSWNSHQRSLIRSTQRRHHGRRRNEASHFYK